MNGAEYKDFYAILGVHRADSEAEIKHVFGLAAKRYHPDKTRNDLQKEREFKKISEAYGILRDPVKRAVYNNLYDAVNADISTPIRRDWGQYQEMMDEIWKNSSFEHQGRKNAIGIKRFTNKMLVPVSKKIMDFALVLQQAMHRKFAFSVNRVNYYLTYSLPKQINPGAFIETPEAGQPILNQRHL